MSEHKSIAEMLGEYLREAAVLSGVFIPLDRILSQGKTFTRQWFWITVGVSVVLLVAGITLERVRPAGA